MIDILFTGSGRSGSWKIRGEQLGRALGSIVLPNALDVGGYRAAVLVKRPPAALVERLHRAGTPIVWDVVDAWPQPEGNQWSATQALHWMRGALTFIKPVAVVAATEWMSRDIRSMYDGPILVLPHHAYPALKRNPIREDVGIVGYEGGPNYIQGWMHVFNKECAKRRWTFMLNPPALAVLDIVVAVRSQTGYAPRHWKSNVKLANAQGSGTPCVLAREQGYLETASGAELWADTPEELAEAFDSLRDRTVRSDISSRLYAAAPRIEAVTAQYKEWLSGLNF